ncbi:hypothetical protein CDAR_489301 [Caerostris darwini]|uniref:Uncharacterized protein n=1 Tax=Caerostris darwini TaxID=1538125 RepID=A0AAV4U039_9ARAC|nr:hypothetical protein CDAR_489301 [Caerostris darwini]
MGKSKKRDKFVPRNENHKVHHWSIGQSFCMTTLDRMSYERLSRNSKSWDTKLYLIQLIYHFFKHLDNSCKIRSTKQQLKKPLRNSSLLKLQISMLSG